jgi:signal transduction histidine kinase
METKVFTQENTAALIVLSGIFLMLFMGITLLLFFYFSKKKILQKELEKKNIELQHSKDLLLATIAVQEKERKRIAQDLHDDISSKLNVVSLNCHMLSMPDINIEKRSEILDSIVGLSSKALENSRRIAHNLFPPVFDKFGLHAAIEELCSEFNSLENVAVSYKNNVALDNSDKEKHMHVFRILQELLNNSVRHGKASDIVILFEGSEGKTRCHYSDNGKGFDTVATGNKPGLGMKNIQSRIDFLNGTLSIDSKVNQGTTTIFSF